MVADPATKKNLNINLADAQSSFRLTARGNSKVNVLVSRPQAEKALLLIEQLIESRGQDRRAGSGSARTPGIAATVGRCDVDEEDF